MKRNVKNIVLAAILAFTTLFSVGCGLSVTGTEAAKRLLANERLKEGVFTKEGDIFDKGVADMNQLAERATANLNVPHVEVEDASQVVAASSVKSAAKVLKGDYKGKVEIDGDTFRFMDFQEDNNSYGYFENITNAIVSTAKRAADMIDDIKRNVRVVDKWIKMPSGTMLFLHVESNSETLCRYIEGRNSIQVCNRYKNSEGKDVYNIYFSENSFEERMGYIPGERFERTEYMNGGRTYFIADNSKGYWENYVLSAYGNDRNYTPSYFVMKDDICYDSFYDTREQSVGMIKIMSSDRATDIFNFQSLGSEEFPSYAIDIKFSGFDGVDYVEAKADYVEYNEKEGYASIPDGRAKVVMENGKVINDGDTYADGKLEVSRTLVMFYSTGYAGEIILNISGVSYDEMVDILISYLDDVGLRCRRPIDSVMAGIVKAKNDVESIVKYYKWNDVLVTTSEAVAEAEAKEKQKMKDLAAYYQSVKNVEVINFLDTVAIANNIKFADITDITTSAAINGNLVSISTASLTVKDTTLYVRGDEYKVSVALVPVNGDGLVHVEQSGNGTVNYDGESEFTVKTENITFTLPDVDAGEYKVVAYIATSDDIRVSKYEAVIFDGVNVNGVKIGVRDVTAKKDSNGTLTLNYGVTADAYATVSTDEAIDYSAFLQLISTEAFEHGMPDSLVEQLTDGGYKPLAGDETEIASGKYRISYTSYKGSTETKGYLYVDYTFGAN